MQLGLVKASLFSILLLTVGSILMATAFTLTLVYGPQPLFTVSLLAIAAADYIVLGKYKTLHFLSKRHALSKNQDSVAQDIVALSAHNPQWITLVSQAIVFTSLMLLVGKFVA